MERAWGMVKKWLFPGWKGAVPLAVLGAGGLYLVFGRGLEETPLAYAAYILSCYALVAVTEAAVRSFRRAWRRLTEIPLVARWRADANFRVRMGLLLSLAINLCYAVMRMGYAALYASFWDGALGAYYILLCAVRLYLIRRTPKTQEEARYVDELRACRCTGWLLLVLDLALVWISVQIVLDGQGYDYPGTMIYVAALYAFYSLTISIVNAVKYRRFRSPVLSAAKAVSLTTAMVSIFSLETAMLSRFGGEPRFQFLMTAGTAGAVCCLVLATALFMTISASRTLRRQ